MSRNLDHRIEVLVPVENARLRQDVHATLDSALADDTNSWLLEPDGTWTRADPGSKPHNHHGTMMRRVQAKARRRARERRGV
jgi:polyphosphate kinase